MNNFVDSLFAAKESSHGPGNPYWINNTKKELDEASSSVLNLKEEEVEEAQEGLIEVAGELNIKKLKKFIKKGQFVSLGHNLRTKV